MSKELCTQTFINCFLVKREILPEKVMKAIKFNWISISSICKYVSFFYINFMFNRYNPKDKLYELATATSINNYSSSENLFYLHDVL